MHSNIIEVKQKYQLQVTLPIEEVFQLNFLLGIGLKTLNVNRQANTTRKALTSYLPSEVFLRSFPLIFGIVNLTFCWLQTHTI